MNHFSFFQFLFILKKREILFLVLRLSLLYFIKTLKNIEIIKNTF